MSTQFYVSQPSTTDEALVTYHRAETLRAIKTVMTYTVADVFDLTEEEIIWTAYHIENALKPFATCQQLSIASSVRHEILTGDYSNRLNKRSQAEPKKSSGSVAEADVIDWATVLSNIVTQTYNARPIITTGFVGQIAGILTELGVGNPNNPRASRYLPNAVRYLNA